jgi:hypothetical protein
LADRRAIPASRSAFKRLIELSSAIDAALCRRSVKPGFASSGTMETAMYHRDAIDLATAPPWLAESSTTH